jgi:hypothetical protein
MTPAGQRVRGHPGVGHEVDVLSPQRAQDVLRDLAGDLGAAARFEKGPAPRGLTPVHLPELYPSEQGVLDHPGGFDGGEDLGDAAEHASLAHDGLELLLVVHAVLDGEHAGVRAEHGREGASRALRIEGLDAEEHEIRRPQPVELVHGGSFHHPFPFRGGLHPEPLGADRLEVRAARHEGDVLSRPRELRPEETAGASRSHHDDAHGSPWSG